MDSEQLLRDTRRMAVAAAVAVVLALGVAVVVSSKRVALTEKVEKIGSNSTSFYKADTAWQQQKARETIQNFTLGGNAVARFCALAALVSRGNSLAEDFTQVFEDLVFSYDTLAQRLRELAFLNQGIEITLESRRLDPPHRP